MKMMMVTMQLIEAYGGTPTFWLHLGPLVYVAEAIAVILADKTCRA